MFKAQKLRVTRESKRHIIQPKDSLSQLAPLSLTTHLSPFSVKHQKVHPNLESEGGGGGGGADASVGVKVTNSNSASNSKLEPNPGSAIEARAGADLEGSVDRVRVIDVGAGASIRTDTAIAGVKNAEQNGGTAI
jgi:hypothetical protein